MSENVGSPHAPALIGEGRSRRYQGHLQYVLSFLNTKTRLVARVRHVRGRVLIALGHDRGDQGAFPAM